MKKIITALLGIVVLAAILVTAAFSMDMIQLPEDSDSQEEQVEVSDTTSEDITLCNNITYKETDQDLCKMDIAYRDDGEKKPLIVFVHGGSWYGGDKEDMTPYINAFSERGYVAVTVGYDLIDLKHLLAEDALSIRDQEKMVVEAIETLVSRAEEFQIDTSRIYLMGHSAGGQLVGNITERVAKNPDNYSFSVSAMILVSAASDFRYILYEMSPDELEGLSLAVIPSIFAGEYNSDVITEMDKVDVLANVNSAMPPTLLIHGTSDSKVASSCSEELYEALQTAGVTSELDLIQGQPHAMDKNIVATKINTFLKELS